MLNYFKTTAFKFKTASVIYKILMLMGVKKQRTIRRNGITFEVDLAEGIDLSLFLFGVFQKNVTQGHLFSLPKEAIIIDVGANIGSIALPLAHHCSDGTVYAFEPTNFAFKKLQRNIRLNPHLQGKIVAIQSLLSSSCKNLGNSKIYSSWNVSQGDDIKHQIHHGTAMEATGVQTTLDSFTKERGFKRLDFIKIDTDGHELEVLTGAIETLSKFRPVVVFELTLYLLEEQGISFAEFEDIFIPLQYRLVDTKSGKEINHRNYTKLAPHLGSTDVAAIPGNTHEGTV